MGISTKFVSLLVGLLTTFSASAARITILVGGSGGENNYYTTDKNGAPALANSTTTINVGDDVEFKYVSGFHPTMSDNPQPAWATFTPSAQKVSTIVGPFTTAGTHPYHCQAHGAPGLGMAGVITVTAAPLATAAPVAASALNIFPNPSRGLVNITLTERTKADYKLRLRNVIGQEVRTVALHPELSNSLTLDLSDLPAGLYLYSLLVDNKAVLTKRLTLQ